MEAVNMTDTLPESGSERSRIDSEIRDDNSVQQDPNEPVKKGGRRWKKLLSFTGAGRVKNSFHATPQQRRKRFQKPDRDSAVHSGCNLIDYRLIPKWAAIAEPLLDPTYRSMLSIGELYVHVVEARGLKPSDINGFSDPYCKLKLTGRCVIHDGQEWPPEHRSRSSTDVMLKTLDPIWDEEHIFPVRRAGGVLQVMVYDWDRTSFDDFLGCVDIPLDGALREQDVVDAWYPLKPVSTVTAPGEDGNDAPAPYIGGDGVLAEYMDKENPPKDSNPRGSGKVPKSPENVPPSAPEEETVSVEEVERTCRLRQAIFAIKGGGHGHAYNSGGTSSVKHSLGFIHLRLRYKYSETAEFMSYLWLPPPLIVDATAFSPNKLYKSFTFFWALFEPYANFFKAWDRFYCWTDPLATLIRLTFLVISMIWPPLLSLYIHQHFVRLAIANYRIATTKQEDAPIIPVDVNPSANPKYFGTGWRAARAQRRNNQSKRRSSGILTPTHMSANENGSGSSGLISTGESGNMVVRTDTSAPHTFTETVASAIAHAGADGLAGTLDSAPGGALLGAAVFGLETEGAGDSPSASVTSTSTHGRSRLGSFTAAFMPGNRGGSGALLSQSAHPPPLSITPRAQTIPNSTDSLSKRLSLASRFRLRSSSTQLDHSQTSTSNAVHKSASFPSIVSSNSHHGPGSSKDVASTSGVHTTPSQNTLPKALVHTDDPTLLKRGEEISSEAKFNTLVNEVGKRLLSKSGPTIQRKIEVYSVDLIKMHKRFHPRSAYRLFVILAMLVVNCIVQIYSYQTGRFNIYLISGMLFQFFKKFMKYYGRNFIKGLKLALAARARRKKMEKIRRECRLKAASSGNVTGTVTGTVTSVTAVNSPTSTISLGAGLHTSSTPLSRNINGNSSVVNTSISINSSSDIHASNDIQNVGSHTDTIAEITSGVDMSKHVLVVSAFGKASVKVLKSVKPSRRVRIDRLLLLACVPIAILCSIYVYIRGEGGSCITFASPGSIENLHAMVNFSQLKDMFLSGISICYSEGSKAVEVVRSSILAQRIFSYFSSVVDYIADAYEGGFLKGVV